jgi:hypothetical protein
MGPQSSRSHLEIRNNSYVVQNGFLFEYYPLVCNKTQRGNFIDIEISPGVMAAGVAILDQKLYDVSLEDLLRRRINVRKQRVTDERKHKRVGKSSSVPKPKMESESIVSPTVDESGTSKAIGDQVSKAADVAWQDQVDTLLETLHSQEGEEFEVTGSTQSRSLDPDSSIPDIFEDIEQDPDT